MSGRRVLWTTGLGLLAIAGAATAETVSLPSSAKQAINEYFVFSPRNEAIDSQLLQLQSFDLAGDGKTEYLMQYDSQGGSDGQSDCTKLLFAPDAGGTYALASMISCCHVRSEPARKGKGGKLICQDDHSTAFEWKGAWPHPKFDLVTLSQVKDDFTKGKKLFVAKNYAAAEPLLCEYEQLKGDRSPEYATGCAAARIAQSKFDDAISSLQEVVAEHPEATDLYLQLAKATEVKGQRQQALDYYSKYLQTAKPGVGRTLAEERIKALKQQ